MFSIGELSRHTGVSTQTIRYYEKIGLLPIPERRINGYRQYADTDIERLQFIRKARLLDFNLDEINEILSLRERSHPPCKYVMDIMVQKNHEIETRINDLQQLKREVSYLHQKGSQMPEDVHMQKCVCSLIRQSEHGVP